MSEICCMRLVQIFRDVACKMPLTSLWLLYLGTCSQYFLLKYKFQNLQKLDRHTEGLLHFTNKQFVSYDFKQFVSYDFKSSINLFKKFCRSAKKRGCSIIKACGLSWTFAVNGGSYLLTLQEYIYVSRLTVMVRWRSFTLFLLLFSRAWRGLSCSASSLLSLNRSSIRFLSVSVSSYFF